MAEHDANPEMDEKTYELAQLVFQLVRDGKADELKRSLEMGLPVNIRTGNGDSLLMLASYNGHYEMTKLLLAHGADPELANDRQQTPLAGVAFKGYKDIAELLIENGANVNATTPDGKTALMFAAMFNQLEVVECLLTHGADASMMTDEGKTALILADAMGAADTRERLRNA